MPFGEYTNFDDCVKKNQNKDDPEAYCASIKNKVEKMIDWQYDMTFEKVGDKGGHLYLAGFASNGDTDEDSQNMDMESLKAVFDTYMKNPVVKLLHDTTPQWKGAIGKVVEKYVDSDGKEWLTNFGAKPFLVVKLSKSPKLEWLRGMIDEGLFRGFSIGGKAKTISKDGKIVVKSWLETSIVDVPSAKGSFFQVLKAACVGDNCPISQDDEVETDGEPDYKKEPNPAVLKFIDAVDSFEGGNISSNENGVNGFCKAADDFLKGGPGSGVKGHKTAANKTLTDKLNLERKSLYAAQHEISDQMIKMDLKLDKDYKSAGSKITETVKADKAIYSTLSSRMGKVNDRLRKITETLGDYDD